MSNAHDTMRQALQEAKDVMRAADEHANAMVLLLIGPDWSPTNGRLRHVSADHLKRLKAALRDFDAHKLEWKGAKP
jgi:hypothetical protein